MDKLKFFKYAYGCDPELLPEVMVITPFLPISRFGRYCDVHTEFKGRMYSGAIAKKNGREAGIIRCGIGDRLLGDAVLLLEISAVKKVVFAGSCASLCDARIGDLFSARRALGGEGFSRYYKKDSDIKDIMDSEEFISSDAQLTEDLINFVSKNLSGANKLFSGDIFSIGSIVAEEKELVVPIKARGFSAIEMELSAVYQAAGIAGIKAASLLWVSDLPLERPLWEELGQEERIAQNKGIEEAIHWSVEYSFSL